jgi:ABC-2 type transport system ATP-binding protein
MAQPLLNVNNLSRSSNGYEALKPVQFQLNPGDLVAVSGPNGAGKSTLLLCLSGMMQPTSGEVTVEGYDLYRDEVEARRRLAFVPDVPVFYPELTAWEHLYLIATAHRSGGTKRAGGTKSAGDDFEARAEALLRDFQLWEARDLFPHAYSRGMRLKLGIALALIRPLKVLVLDEPSSALDAESLEVLAEKLLDLRRSGAALLLTSHDAHFTERLSADHWRMDNGRLITA